MVENEVGSWFFGCILREEWVLDLLRSDLPFLKGFYFLAGLSVFFGIREML